MLFILCDEVGAIDHFIHVAFVYISVFILQTAATVHYPVGKHIHSFIKTNKD